MNLQHQPIAGPSQRLLTPSLASSAIAFSPFEPNLLAFAANANFGLSGKGKAVAVSFDPSLTQPMRIVRAFDTLDGVFDIAFSEASRSQLVSVQGDGKVHLWDLSNPEAEPIRSWHEHTRETMCVDWSNTQKDTFCTSSWDGSIKLWTPARQLSILTILPPNHDPQQPECIYKALFSPSVPNQLLSISSTGLGRLYDLRSNSPQVPAVTFKASPGGTEVLCADWAKYVSHHVAIGGVDRTVAVYDIRFAAQGRPPVDMMLGSQKAVRTVQWDPYRRDRIAAGGYDMTTRIWESSLGQNEVAPQPARQVHVDHSHTEFVTGVAWSIFERGLIGTVGWDGGVRLWRGPT